ncbi:MAG: acyl-CoA thioesterase [Thermoplasmata archaeon]
MDPVLSARSPSASRAQTMRLLLPADGNPMGTVFGGVILEEIDRVAFVAAVRHADLWCVTASFDRVDFIAPVFVGDIVHFDARVTYVGTSAIEVRVRVETERVGSRALTLVGNAFVTMVAIGADKHPHAVRALELGTEEDRRLFHEGEERMEERQRTRAMARPGGR